MGCGTLTFVTDRIEPGASNCIKFTGTGGFEAFETLSGFASIRFFQYCTEYPNRSILLQNGRAVEFDNISLFLLTKRLLVKKTTLTLYADNNIVQPYEQNISVFIAHSGVTGYEKIKLVPRVTTNTLSSGVFYPLFQSDKQFWIQRGFNFYIDVVGAVTPETSCACIQFEIDKIDTYANPYSVYETECAKIPFDKITQPIPVN